MQCSRNQCSSVAVVKKDSQANSHFWIASVSTKLRNACPRENGGRLIGSPLLWEQALRGGAAAEAIYSFVREEKV